MPGVDFGEAQRLGQTNFTHHMAAQRRHAYGTRQGQQGIRAGGQETLHLGHEPGFGHGLQPGQKTRPQHVGGRRHHQAAPGHVQGAGAPRPLPVTQRTAGGKKHLQPPDQALGVARRKTFRKPGIVKRQFSPEGIPAKAGMAGGNLGPHVGRNIRDLSQSLHQRPEVEARAPHQQRHAPGGMGICNGSPRKHGPARRRTRVIRRACAVKAMGCAAKVAGRGLCREQGQGSIDLHAVSIYDLGTKPFRQGERKGRLAAGRRTCDQDRPDGLFAIAHALHRQN